MPSTGNLARDSVDIPMLTKFTRQSSTARTDNPAMAARALVAGPRPESCSQTRVQENPWWSTAFDGLYQVNSVEAFVRIYHDEGECGAGWRLVATSCEGRR